MELATPPPAARAPVAWYSWWLMPLSLGGGTVAATFMSSERITAAVAGLAATAASAVCVRLLLRTRAHLHKAENSFRTTHAEHNQQRDGSADAVTARVRHGLRSYECGPPANFFSPAGTAMDSLFCGGGSGQVAKAVKAQGGL